jgi:hypothetical protein
MSDLFNDLPESLSPRLLKLTWEISHAEDNIPIRQLAQGYIRYEKLRLLSARAYAELSKRNLDGEGSFDDLVDGLEGPK